MHTLYHGDAIEVLKGLADNSIDAICCDPPAGISFMGLEFDHDKGGRDQWIAWLSGIMKECHRVLKPGGHAFVWSLPRTSHWTGMALELAGFEVRDLVSHLYDSSRDVQAFLETLSPEQRNLLEIILANNNDTFSAFLHCFGSGFPKSLSISKAINQHLGMEREVVGDDMWANKKRSANFGGGVPLISNITAPASPEAKQWDGWHSNLKPAFEQWWLVRKPLSEPTIAANVLKWSTGGINVDASRIPTNEDENEAILKKHDSFKNSEVNNFKDGWRRPWMDKEDSEDKIRQMQDDSINRTVTLGRFPANVILSKSPERYIIRDNISNEQYNTLMEWINDYQRKKTRQNT